MSEADDVMFGWAKKCVEDTQWLFHTPTLVVGPAEECFDGVATVYVSEVNGEPVTGPVIKLANGHALMANPNAFIELAPREVEFYRLAVDAIDGPGDVYQRKCSRCEGKGIEP